MRKWTKLAAVIFATGTMLTACNDNNDDKEIPENPDDGSVEKVTDLGKDEKANCYIVQQAGEYKFEATNQFNLGEGLPVPPQISPESAKLLWQSKKGSINAVELVNENGTPYVKFNVADPSGNAVIAVCNQNGDIEWSWHIWMPEEQIFSIPTQSGYEVMNLNLGALNNTPGDVKSYGMLYQWGRKDPFPAAGSLTGTTSTVSAPMFDIEGSSVYISNSSWTDNTENTLDFSIRNPTVCLSNYAQYSLSRDWLNHEYSDDALWGNPEGDLREDGVYVNKGVKTCYDPSPAGWRVAPADVFLYFTATGGYDWVFENFNVYDINKDGIIDLNDYNYGWHFMINSSTPLYFPAAARFDGSYAMLMGSVSGIWGNYWSNTPKEAGCASSVLAFQAAGQNGEDYVTVSPLATASRADAYSIRCVRD